MIRWVVTKLNWLSRANNVSAVAVAEGRDHQYLSQRLDEYGASLRQSRMSELKLKANIVRMTPSEAALARLDFEFKKPGSSISRQEYETKKQILEDQITADLQGSFPYSQTKEVLDTVICLVINITNRFVFLIHISKFRLVLRLHLLIVFPFWLVVQLFRCTAMGNKSCVECSEDISQNNAYGNYQVLSRGLKAFAVVEKVLSFQGNSEQQLRKQLQTRLETICLNIVNLHHFRIYRECYGFRVVLHYEYVGKCLTDRIGQLRLQNEPFSERQLSSLVYGIEKALKKLYSLGIKHGCLNTGTIMAAGTFYKLTDVSSTTHITSYQLHQRGSDRQFLSPRLLHNLAFKSLDPGCEIEDDFFSLGMIVLSVVSGFDPIAFYSVTANKKELILNRKAIDKAMRMLQRNYSSKLVGKVKQLLGQNCDDSTIQGSTFAGMIDTPIDTCTKIQKAHINMT